jgi:hypothetical protein
VREAVPVRNAAHKHFIGSSCSRGNRFFLLSGGGISSNFRKSLVEAESLLTRGLLIVRSCFSRPNAHDLDAIGFA